MNKIFQKNSRLLLTKRFIHSIILTKKAIAQGEISGVCSVDTPVGGDIRA